MERGRRLGERPGPDPVRALAAGVLKRAVDDVRQTKMSGIPAQVRAACAAEAAAWLAGEGAEEYCGALGIEAATLRQALRLGR